jgi:hypothetical protein
MSKKELAERRRHQRFTAANNVRFVHLPSHGSFPGRCANISAGGLMMYVPAATPVQPGQAVRLTVGESGPGELVSFGRKQFDATVVRVDRRALLTGGHLAVGVRFDQG